MIRKILTAIFSIATIGFLILTIQRWTFDYNENGVYFDGVTTYDTDSLLGFTATTVLFLVLTMGIVVFKKK